MAKLKLFSVAHSLLNSIPVVAGQIVCTSDVNGFYYDFNSKRHKLQPADDVLYSLISKDNTTSTGVSGSISYTQDTGTLQGTTQLTACEYECLEFVFYERGSGTQFSAFLHGLPYGDDGLYTYNWCNKATCSLDVDTTQTVGDNNIYRETVYATVVLTADGTFTVTSKTHITETVQGGIVTMAEKDISEDNRVALIKVIGRR